jgi:hypothetical protein
MGDERVERLTANHHPQEQLSHKLACTEWQITNYDSIANCQLPFDDYYCILSAKTRWTIGRRLSHLALSKRLQATANTLAPARRRRRTASSRAGETEEQSILRHASHRRIASNPIPTR